MIGRILYLIYGVNAIYFLRTERKINQNLQVNQTAVFKLQRELFLEDHGKKIKDREQDML